MDNNNFFDLKCDESQCYDSADDDFLVGAYECLPDCLEGQGEVEINSIEPQEIAGNLIRNYLIELIS